MKSQIDKNIQQRVGENGEACTKQQIALIACQNLKKWVTVHTVCIVYMNCLRAFADLNNYSSLTLAQYIGGKVLESALMWNSSLRDLDLDLGKIRILILWNWQMPLLSGRVSSSRTGCLAAPTQAQPRCGWAGLPRLCRPIRVHTSGVSQCHMIPGCRLSNCTVRPGR